MLNKSKMSPKGYIHALNGLFFLKSNRVSYIVSSRLINKRNFTEFPNLGNLWLRPVK